MNTFGKTNTLFYILAIALFLTACAGGEQFSAATPAGFWYGLWHGVISVPALIVHIFNESVMIYETNNTGGWYDFGFLLGVICVWGGGSHVHHKSKAEKQRDKEWGEIGDKVEQKIIRKLREWAAEEDGKEIDEEWKEVGEKAEKKLKRIIREWAEKD